ncbi:MAG: hypothetical protein AAFW81_10210 [Pseudomonadota bacterium]
MIIRKIAAIAALSLLAVPAMAAKTTIEFKRDTGQSQVVTLDGEGTATTADGATLPYTYDAETNKMCFTLPDETVNCVTFAETVPEPKVGDAVRYTAADGAEGTATITAIVE